MRTRLWVPGLLLVMMASSASADPVTIPPGLAPGSVYHLAFVTSGSHNALSTDIADYDAFVTAQANLDPFLAALNTTWSVIGSTETVDAIDHIGVVGPVYNTRGQLVTDTLAHMFGSGGLAGVIGYYQDGGFFAGNEYVWTGTGTDGRAANDLGPQYLAGRPWCSHRFASRTPSLENWTASKWPAARVRSWGSPAPPTRSTSAGLSTTTGLPRPLRWRSMDQRGAHRAVSRPRTPASTLQRQSPNQAR